MLTDGTKYQQKFLESPPKFNNYLRIYIVRRKIAKKQKKGMRGNNTFFGKDRNKCDYLVCILEIYEFDGFFYRSNSSFQYAIIAINKGLPKPDSSVTVILQHR